MKKYLIAAGAGAMLVALGIVKNRKKDWEGITEEAARARLDSALPKRVPDAKRTQITEKVVMKMKERGVIAGATKFEMEPTVVTDEATPADAPAEAPTASEAAANGAGVVTSTSGH